MDKFTLRLFSCDQWSVITRRMRSFSLRSILREFILLLWKAHCNTILAHGWLPTLSWVCRQRRRVKIGQNIFARSLNPLLGPLTPSYKSLDEFSQHFSPFSNYYSSDGEIIYEEGCASTDKRPTTHTDSIHNPEEVQWITNIIATIQ